MGMGVRYQQGFVGALEDIKSGVTREEACADNIDDLISNLYDDGPDDVSIWPESDVRAWAQGYVDAWKGK